jgi:hypothetical protein
MKRPEPVAAVFKHSPPDLAVVISEGTVVRDDIVAALREPPLSEVPLVFVADRAAAPKALMDRILRVLRPEEAKATLVSAVQEALRHRLEPGARLPDRIQLIDRMDSIAKKAGSLEGVGLISVDLPLDPPVATERLEKQLRRRDFVAWLPPNKFVLLVSDAREDDLPALRQRFIDAICQAAGGRAISDERVEVALASVGHTSEELLRSVLLEGR